MIVVEGPDGAGKSMLIRHLTTKFPQLEVAPRAVDGEGKIVKPISKYVEEAFDNPNDRLLYDRFALISEYIYAAKAKRIPREQFSDTKWLQEMWARWVVREPLLIICLPPRQVVWENIKNDEENRKMFPGIAGFNAVYHLYQALATQNPDSFMYDYTDPDDFRLLCYLVDYYLKKKGVL